MKYLLIVLVFLTSCSINKNKTKESMENTRKKNTLEEYIVITGMAYNRKGGAIIELDSIHYWIDGMEYWEDEYVNKKVTVKGQINIRDDNPVFLDTSDIKMQGIPVYSEEELNNNLYRTWLIRTEILKVE